MATARHVIGLLRSHIEGDDEQFLSVAVQMAAHEARQGHSKLAVDLKKLIETARCRRASPAAALRRWCKETKREHCLHYVSSTNVLLYTNCLYSLRLNHPMIFETAYFLDLIFKKLFLFLCLFKKLKKSE